VIQGRPHNENGIVARETKSVPPLVGPEGRSYEKLEGGEGREVFFRPHRYQREDLGPVEPTVEVALLGRTPRDCALVDISQNGLAFEWADGEVVDLGTVIPELVVRFDAHEAYRGEAQVSSVREGAGKRIVGASFVDSLMNIEDVIRLRDIRAWRTESGDALASIGKSWRVAGHERFKSLVGELRLLLEDAEEHFRELEAALPWDVVHGDDDSLARDALVARIQDEFAPDVVESTIDIDAAVRTAAPAELQALKEYSTRNLHGLFMQSPWMRRALHKPLGYAGDFEIMNGLYERRFDGSTLFAKALNLSLVSTPAAAGVPSRKNVMKAELSRLLDARGTGPEPFRILSVAAGPAQEVYELLRDRSSLPRPLEVVLFDQDKGALTYAYSRLKRLLQRKWPDGVSVVYLHDSIGRLLRDAGIFNRFPEFDVIFSCGLFDYLQHPTAIALCANLFAKVAPQGSLYIGNIVPSQPTRWIMEFHLNWFLTYRTRAELTELARVAIPSAHIEIKEEPLGVNPFLVGAKV
jgi:hypothetical protein